MGKTKNVVKKMGTVKGPSSEQMNPALAAEALRKAFKGLGTDEKVIIDVVAYHTNEQRQVIKQSYKEMYGKEVIYDMEDELGGHFLDTLLALMSPPHLYDAHCIRKAIVGTVTDEDCLVEIICSRTTKELHQIKVAYYSEFHRNLENDLLNETCSDFGRLLRELLIAEREESTSDVNKDLAETDATKLQAAGVSKLGTDIKVFQQIICIRSWAQLRATFEAYRNRTHRDVETDIRREFSGDVRDGLLAIVKLVKNHVGFFADKIHESLKGVSTDDETLIRLIVSRSETDLEQIKEEYQRKYKKTLAKAIREDCTGDYCRLLSKILGP